MKHEKRLGKRQSLKFSIHYWVLSNSVYGGGADGSINTSVESGIIGRTWGSGIGIGRIWGAFSIGCLG